MAALLKTGKQIRIQPEHNPTMASELCTACHWENILRILLKTLSWVHVLCSTQVCWCMCTEDSDFRIMKETNVYHNETWTERAKFLQNKALW